MADAVADPTGAGLPADVVATVRGAAIASMPAWVSAQDLAVASGRTVPEVWAALALMRRDGEVKVFRRGQGPDVRMRFHFHGLPDGRGLGRWWWALLLTGLAGGVVGYLSVRGRDEPLAVRILAWGFAVQVVGTAIALGLVALSG